MSDEQAISLCKRWKNRALQLDALADDCADLCEDKDASECREMARAFRECANDIYSIINP